MPAPPDEARLVALARATPWFMDALGHVRALRLPAWCVGAGAVRSLVWDALRVAGKRYAQRWPRVTVIEA